MSFTEHGTAGSVLGEYSRCGERPSDSVYKIDADLADVVKLEEHLMAAFRDNDESLLLAYSMTIRRA